MTIISPETQKSIFILDKSSDEMMDEYDLTKPQAHNITSRLKHLGCSNEDVILLDGIARRV